MVENDFLNKVFGKNNVHFNDWYINFSGESTSAFLDKVSLKHDFSTKIFGSLYMYIESLRTLKDQENSVDNFDIKNLCSHEAWYCSNLLLFVSACDQFTKLEVKEDGSLECLKNRFVTVMMCLDEKDKNQMRTHYLAPNILSSFKKVAKHIYGTRNFFAHELQQLHDNIPHRHELTFTEDKEYGYIGHLTLPREKILLYAYMALFKYLGYEGDIFISTTRKYNSLADLMR